MQYTAPGINEPTLGVLSDTAIYRAPKGWPPTSLALLDNWSEFVGQLAVLRAEDLEPATNAKLVAPITYPRKLICAGANFYSHAAEMGTPPPDPSAPPFFFLKPPTTTVIGPDALAPLPSGDDPMYDWEAELGIVIGARCKDVSPAEASKFIAGFVVANDLSARGRFTRPSAKEPFAWDWLGQKSQDGSCPIGPGIVPAWMVPKIASARITLSVNGELKQDSNMSDIIVGIYNLVSSASKTLTLEPGDVILAGTPAGVGMPRQTFLRAGDLVEATIEGVGSLRTFIGEAA